MSDCLVIGHRGAAGYVAENTLASFEKAFEMGAGMVELDVHLCATGELVVIHDKTVKRTTGVNGKVHKLSLRALQQLDAGGGQRIPTLAQVIEQVNRRMVINIELKGKHTALPVSQLIANYIQGGYHTYQDFLISSFDHEQLLVLRECNAHLRLAPLVKRLPRHLVQLIESLQPVAININYRHITPSVIARVHEARLKLIAWTVNDPKDIHRLKEMGVGGIISDRPDLLTLDPTSAPKQFVAT